MTKTDWIATFAAVFLVTAFIGNNVGFTVSGIHYTISDNSPGILGVIEWFWESAVFLFSLLTWRLDGCPAIMHVFYDFIFVIMIWIILSTTRGSGD